MQSAAENKCRKKKNPKKPKVFDKSLLWNSGKMFNFQLLGLVPCICTLWWWEQFLASSSCKWSFVMLFCWWWSWAAVRQSDLTKVHWEVGGRKAGMATVSGLWTLSWNWSFFKKIKLSLACVWEMWPLVGSASGHEAALVVEASLQTCPGPFCTPKAHLLCKDP